MIQEKKIQLSLYLTSQTKMNCKLNKYFYLKCEPRKCQKNVCVKKYIVVGKNSLVRAKHYKTTYNLISIMKSQVSLVVTNLPINSGDVRDVSQIPGLQRSLEEGMATTPVFFPGESYGQRRLAGYSSQGCTESDTTEVTQHTHA